MTEKELQVHEKREAKQAGEPTKSMRHFVPPVDIYETEQEVTLIAEMPGVDKNGVDIQLEDGVLTITGVMTDLEQEGEKTLLQEFESGHYIRRFTIAETIAQDRINAAMKNGILQLTLPKIEPARPRKIHVQG